MAAQFHSVGEVLENYRRAVFERDVERFLASYSADIHVFDCWGLWERNGISAWKEMASEWFAGLKNGGEQDEVEIDELRITEKGDLACAHAAVTFIARDQQGKELRRISNRFTFALKRGGGSWRIFHEHSSLPISVENGKAIFQRK